MDLVCSEGFWEMAGTGRLHGHWMNGNLGYDLKGFAADVYSLKINLFIQGTSSFELTSG